nr:hypothetical protein Itr_chr12CG17860 [Ipomoea trifida]
MEPNLVAAGSPASLQSQACCRRPWQSAAKANSDAAHRPPLATSSRFVLRRPHHDDTEKLCPPSSSHFNPAWSADVAHISGLHVATTSLEAWLPPHLLCSQRQQPYSIAAPPTPRHCPGIEVATPTGKVTISSASRIPHRRLLVSSLKNQHHFKRHHQRPPVSHQQLNSKAPARTNLMISGELGQ